MAYTSLQKRAIRTLDLALRELDALWLPVHRHWRLNERHYGALQGKNKKEVREEHGDDQLHAWRRGYDTPPPPLAADDPRHPRHDPRYRDVPARPAAGLASASRTWSSACSPTGTTSIAADLLAGKRVIVSAHGNSLRALVKHLDGISDDDIAELNIPTGIPLLYELDDADPCTQAARRALPRPRGGAGRRRGRRQAGRVS